MALGRYSDMNFARTATLTGGAWAAALPLSNLQDDARYVGAPARQLTPGTLANSLFNAALDRPRAVNLIGVLFHTFGLNAVYRLRLASPGGTLDAPASITDWTPVYSRTVASAQTPWEESNWWTGQPLASDLDVYPRHLWIRVTAPFLVSALRLEFDDSAIAAGYFDIGGLWIASTWSPAFNFDRGRELRIEPRDQEDEAPSGRLFFEKRGSRRSLSVTWSALTDAEGYRFAASAARAGRSTPVLFAPDTDDQLSLAHEAFPAVFAQTPGPRFHRDAQNTVSATFKEIIA